MGLQNKPIIMFRLCKHTLTIEKKEIVRATDHNVWFFNKNGYSVMENRETTSHKYFCTFEGVKEQAWTKASLKLGTALSRLNDINEAISYLSALKEGEL